MTTTAKKEHWTEKSTKDFLYRIASDFVEQVELRLEAKNMSRSDLAASLGVSKGRVSQLLNNPGNLTLEMIIRSARSLGMKVALVAYDDGDQKNERGPITAEVFRICWERCGKPADLWFVQEEVYRGVGITAGRVLRKSLEGVYTVEGLPTMFGGWVSTGNLVRFGHDIGLSTILRSSLLIREPLDFARDEEAEPWQSLKP